MGVVAEPKVCWYKRIGRVQVSLMVWHHRYGGDAADRWVIKPDLIYDQKRRGG